MWAIVPLFMCTNMEISGSFVKQEPKVLDVQMKERVKDSKYRVSHIETCLSVYLWQVERVQFLLFFLFLIVYKARYFVFLKLVFTKAVHPSLYSQRPSCLNFARACFIGKICFDRKNLSKHRTAEGRQVSFLVNC